MKILYILHVAEMHGSSISIFNTIKGVKEKGIEPILIIPNGQPCDDGFNRYIDKLGVNYYKVTLVQSVIDKNLFSSWSLKQKIHFFFIIYRQKYHSYKLISKIVTHEKPSIIHTNSGVIHEGFWVAKKHRIPHIFHIREYQNEDFGWTIIPSKYIFCWMLKKSHVITITNALRKHFNLEKHRNARTIYNGIYSQERTSLFFPKDKFFFCASRISKEKGFDDVIMAFAEFIKKHSDYKLLLAGTGSINYIEQLKRLALLNNCSDKIIFLGSIDNVFDYMQKTRALIVGSHSEGFGRMTAEAAFAGSIVIGRDKGGTKEIMDIIGGYRFMNIQGLIASMNIIAELSEKEYHKKAQYAQRQAKEWFSTEKNIEKIFTLYQKIKAERN